MKKTAFLALATGIAGLSACTHLRSPTDDQLIALLHADRTRPNMPQIDVPASQCLRAWSKDADLIAGLPAGFAAEGAAKASCRNRIDGWLADGQRNPANFSFDDISAPGVVRRVVALSEPIALSIAPNPQADHVVPPPTQRPGPGPLADPRSVGRHTDIGTAQALVKAADDACKLAQRKASAVDAPLPLQRLGTYCMSYIPRAQATLADGANAKQLQIDSIARSARNLTTTAQRLLQAPHN